MITAVLGSHVSSLYTRQHYLLPSVVQFDILCVSHETTSAFGIRRNPSFLYGRVSCVVAAFRGAR